MLKIMLLLVGLILSVGTQANPNHMSEALLHRSIVDALTPLLKDPDLQKLRNSIMYIQDEPVYIVWYPWQIHFCSMRYDCGTGFAVMRPQPITGMMAAEGVVQLTLLNWKTAVPVLQFKKVTGEVMFELKLK